MSVPIPRTVSVLIPALNEEKDIADAVASAITALQSRVEDYELLLMNDGSTDRTGSIMDELSAGDPRIRVFHHTSPWNLGGAYRHAIQEARMNYLLMSPGDNENPTTAMTGPIEAIGIADIIVPYPTNQDERPPVRRIGSLGYTWLVNKLFGLHIPYFNGTVIHRLDLLRAVEIRTSSFAYQTEALVKLIRRGATWSAVPIRVDTSSRKSSALQPRNIRGVIGSLYRIWLEERFNRS